MFWSLIVPRVQAVAVVLLAVLMLGWSVWFGVSTVADWILWRQQTTAILQQLVGRALPPPRPGPPVTP